MPRRTPSLERLRAHLAPLVRILLAVAVAAATPSLLAAPALAATPATTVYVTDFGARGDGVTIDTQAIQNAFNAGATPRRVVFPAGTYVFSTVWVGSDTDIVFESGANALTPTGSTLNTTFFAVYGTATNRARNVSLTGGTFTARPTVAGVFVARYADHLRVSNVTTYDCWRLVRTEWCDDVVAADCSVTRAWAGFDIEHSTNVDVLRCTIRSLRRDGILFYASRNVIAADNRVDDYMLDAQPEGVGGIHMYGSTDGTITGNTVTNGHNSAAGIRFRDSERFWCADNTVVSPGGSGLQVHRVGDFPPLNGGDGTFLRNTVTGARLAGVDVANALCLPVRVIGNTIRQTTSSSAIIAGSGVSVMPAGSVIIGNIVQSTTGTGIMAGNNSQLTAWNSVRDPMTVNFGPNAGIYSRGTGGAIVSNEVVDTLRHMRSGLMLYSGSARVTGNVVLGHTSKPTDIRGTLLTSLAGDVSPPIVTSSVQPASGGASGTVTFRASDTQSTIVAVRVWRDGVYVDIAPGAGIAVQVPPTGAHVVEAEAIDRAGNVARATAYTGGYFATMPDVALSTTRTVAWDTTVTISGRLAGPTGAPLAGQRVELQRWDAAWLRWTSSGVSATTDATGIWRLPLRVPASVRVRARFAGSMSLYPVASPPFDVRALPGMSRPAGPSLAVRGKWYTYYGTLTPRHLAGSAPVNLQFFRYESGRWVLRLTVAAKAADVTSGSRYSAPVALSLAGSWKVRVSHPETCHAASSSSFRTFSVR